MYFDWTYVVFVLPMVLIALIAQVKVKTTYSKYSKVLSRRGFTAELAVRKILDMNGLHHITVTRVHGELTDHYDPKNQTIALSDSVYGSTSVAAIGVAAHEAGHAIQHAENYAPMNIRSAIIPIAQLGSNLCMPLVIIGILLEFTPLAYAGIILFGATTLFELVTLPTELDASRRAVKSLSGAYLDDDEMRGVRRVLTAAAMTYLASLLVSLASLLRLVVLVNGGRDRRR